MGNQPPRIVRESASKPLTPHLTTIRLYEMAASPYITGPPSWGAVAQLRLRLICSMTSSPSLAAMSVAMNSRGKDRDVAFRQLTRDGLGSIPRLR